MCAQQDPSLPEHAFAAQPFTRRRLLALAPAGAAALALGVPAPAASAVSAAGTDRAALAQEAYIWGFPLVMMETYLASAREQKVPVNRLFVANSLATPATKAGGPNNDTLFGSAWLDLSREPQVVIVPDTDDRYYSIQLQDVYTNTFAYIGRRTTGTHAGAYALTAPGWKGRLPRGVTRIPAPTAQVLALTRTLVEGEADLPAARAVQAKYALAPLSCYPERAVPAEAVDEPLKFPILDLGAQGAAYFDKLCQGLVAAPPPPSDRARLARFAKIGIGPGRKPTRNAAAVPVLAQAALDANKRITQYVFAVGVNGWTVATGITGFIKDPLYRAAITQYGPGTHVSEEALYFTAHNGPDGQPLNGANRYALRFAAGELPPVDAFWSLTLYGQDWRLVENPIRRYSIGDRTAGLAYGTDGSLELLIQNDEPSEGRANWLPAPTGSFILVLRTYQPGAALLDGSYEMPPITTAGPL
ncbi:DUF1254 domain-containing protein [Streptomyces prunicolor]|uniref:DUF1254 domain-containing protein n=1 Tax=Streptomyces prunicolor TaxID=67348 RepID=A0ABU4F5P9_9ACTN|nr:DUF1254 domain-containing protein [Streptomyces prunicolor]MDV7215905.1 DUF1254 domain-containing protein [Streptomyces prunicolor]